MARSAEKKMTALARWRAVYEDKISFRERPKLASECNSLKDANMFRRQILNEITRKINQIQNSSLGEFKLRDLNDEINRLFREKGHWEDRILELGGTDHKKNSFILMEKEGKSLPGNWGYRYFGAARDLPGVRELFMNEPDATAKRTRVDLSDRYYGYQHEADGVLLPIEKMMEKEYRESLAAERKGKKVKKKTDEKGQPTPMMVEEPEINTESGELNIYETGDNPADVEADSIYEEVKKSLLTAECDGVGNESMTELESRVRRFTSVTVPSQSEIEKTVVGLKKDKILKSYMSDDLIADMINSGSLLGIEPVRGDSEEQNNTESEIEPENP